MTGPKHRIEDYLPRLYGYAVSLSQDRHRAEDLVQSCAVKALAARNVPEDERAYRAWLFRILRNLFIDGLRRERRTADLFEDDPSDVPAMEYLDGDERLIDRLNVRLAYAGLGAAQREILALVDIVGLSYAETADVLGVPAGTVMSRISRARGKLMEAIEESNVRSLPGGDVRSRTGKKSG